MISWVDQHLLYVRKIYGTYYGAGSPMGGCRRFLFYLAQECDASQASLLFSLLSKNFLFSVNRVVSMFSLWDALLKALMMRCGGYFSNVNSVIMLFRGSS